MLLILLHTLGCRPCSVPWCRPCGAWSLFLWKALQRLTPQEIPDLFGDPGDPASNEDVTSFPMYQLRVHCSIAVSSISGTATSHEDAHATHAKTGRRGHGLTPLRSKTAMASKDPVTGRGRTRNERRGNDGAAKGGEIRTHSVHALFCWGE